MHKFYLTFPWQCEALDIRSHDPISTSICYTAGVIDVISLLRYTHHWWITTFMRCVVRKHCCRNSIHRKYNRKHHSNRKTESKLFTVGCCKLFVEYLKRKTRNICYKREQCCCTLLISASCSYHVQTKLTLNIDDKCKGWIHETCVNDFEYSFYAKVRSDKPCKWLWCIYKYKLVVFWGVNKRCIWCDHPSHSF